MVPLWALLGVLVVELPRPPTWPTNQAHKPQTDVQPCCGGLPVRTDVPIKHWTGSVERMQGRPVEVEAPTEEDLVTIHSGRLLPE